MTIDIKAPAFPESVADGTLVTWHKKPGDAVSRDEILVDIETDKVVLEVVAPADGTITEVLKHVGDTIQSQEVICRFNEGAVAASAVAPAAVAKSAAVADEAKISPAARKMIDENNLDANRIAGTGKGGVVTKEDVVAFMQQPAAKSAGNAMRRVDNWFDCLF